MNCLIIKSDENQFERFYNENINSYGVDVLNYRVFRNTSSDKNKLNKLFEYLIKLIFPFSKNKYKNYDTIIIFDDEKLVPLMYRLKGKSTKLILWNWNIISLKKANIENMFKNKCQLWTFDKTDADKYGWKYNEQFYFKPATEMVDTHNNKQTAFCACVDKGRYIVMKEIYNELLEANILCDFFCVKENNKKYEKTDSFLVDKSLPYMIFLEHVKNSDIIVDIVQEGQNGITVRVLEALFYNKKLITNNKSIVNMPFYNSYIYVYGYDNNISFSEFLQLRGCKYDEETKKRYTFESWLANFEFN